MIKNKKDIDVLLELDKENLINKIEKDEISHDMLLSVLKKWGGDKEVVISILQKSAEYVSEISDDLRSDKEVMLIAMQEDSVYMSYASEVLKDDKGFVLQAIDLGCCSLTQVSERLLNDRDVAMMSVGINGLDLCFLNNKFKDDKDVVLTAVTQHADALRYASERLQQDIELLILLREKSFLKGKWYEQRMEYLTYMESVLEDEAWMIENSAVASSKSKIRKF